MGDLPRCHSVVEINDHSGIEKLARGHERLQGVPLHKPHGISKLGKGSCSRYVIKSLILQFLGTAIQVSYNGATMEDRSSDN